MSSRGAAPVLRAGALAAVFAASALSAPALAAPPASISLPGSLDAVTAAQGRAIYAQRNNGAPILIVRERPGPNAPSELLATIRRANAFRDDESASLAANASGWMYALRERDASGRSRRELVVRSGYDGSTQTLVDCVPSEAYDDGAQEPALTVVAGARGFAFAGARCGTSAAVETVAPDGAVSPVPDVVLSPGYSLAYAEPFLAVTVGPAPPLELVRELDLAAGTQRDLDPAYVGRGSALALESDGTLVVGPGTHDVVPATVPQGVYVWPPGAASRPVLQAAGAARGPLLAAGRVLFVPRRPVDGRAALASVGVAGGPVTAVGAPGAGGPRTPLAFDGTTAAFTSFSCQGTPQVTLVDLSEPAAAGAEDGCPVRLARGGIRFGPRGRATIGVRCPNTCNTVLRLVRPRAGTVAVARLQLPASARMRDVALRLTRRGRLARRGHRRLAVVPVSTGVRTP